MMDRIGSLPMKRILYNETDLAASFLSHQESSSSLVVTTGKPEYDPMMGSIFKEFSESYNQANEKWGEPASEQVTKVVSVAFKETLSKTAFKNLLTKVTLPENYKFAQTKLMNYTVQLSKYMAELNKQSSRKSHYNRHKHERN